MAFLLHPTHYFREDSTGMKGIKGMAAKIAENAWKSVENARANVLKSVSNRGIPETTPGPGALPSRASLPR